MKEWINNFKMKTLAKNQEESLIDTRESLDQLIESGYIDKKWDKKKKTWLYVTTKLGRKRYAEQKRRKENERVED